MMRGAVRQGAMPGMGSPFTQGSNVPLKWPSGNRGDGGGQQYASAGVNVPPVQSMSPLGGSPGSPQILPIGEEGYGTESGGLGGAIAGWGGSVNGGYGGGIGAAGAGSAYDLYNALNAGTGNEFSDQGQFNGVDYGVNQPAYNEQGWDNYNAISPATGGGSYGGYDPYAQTYSDAFYGYGE